MDQLRYLGEGLKVELEASLTAAAISMKRIESFSRPKRTVFVAHFPHHGAHEDLNGALVFHPLRHLFASGVVQTQGVPQLRLGRRQRKVNFVAQHQEWHALEDVRGQKSLKYEVKFANRTGWG